MLTRTLIGLLLSVTGSIAAAGNNYDSRRAADLQKCQAIGPREHRSGMVMNPDGYQSYYLRSHCLQRVAESYRDESLCEDVRERWSLFTSTWGVSEKRCRSLVSEGMEQDNRAISALKKTYADSDLIFKDFTVVKNGNGRDFDLIPQFYGDGSLAYTLNFYLLMPDQEPMLIHSSGYNVTGKSRIRIYLPVSELRELVPTFSNRSDHLVRATLEYSTPQGHLQNRWHPDFLEQRFPRSDRTQTLEKRVDFGALKFVPEWN